MNARNKLNVAYFNGCMLIAGVIGLALQSVPIFAVALGVLLLGNLFAGTIRPKGRG